jgi:hypothetical protein
MSDMTFPTLLLVHPTDEFSITILTGVSEVKKCIGEIPIYYFCMPKNVMSVNMNQILQKKIDVRYRPLFNLYLTTPCLSVFLALQPFWVYFHSPVAGFSLLVFEVS